MKMKYIMIVIFALVLIFMLATACVHMERVEKKETKCYSSDNVGRIRVTNISGDVTIHSWDQDMIKVKTIKRAWSQSELNKTKIDVDEGSSLTFETILNNNNSDVVVDYIIYYPVDKTMDLSISTITGDISIKDGNVVYYSRTTTGDVNIVGTNFVQEVETTTGDIKVELHNLNSKAKFKTTTGDIMVYVRENAYDEIFADNTTGDIDIDVPRNGTGEYDISLKATTGDIEVVKI